jgi:hypothetical protein
MSSIHTQILFNNPSSYPDFKIHCGDDVIDVHKVFLYTSPFFNTMFSNSYSESIQNYVCFNDISTENMTIVLKTFYGFDITEMLLDVDTDDKIEIFRYIHMFDVSNLYGKCIESVFRDEDIFRVYGRIINYDDVKKTVETHFANNFVKNLEKNLEKYVKEIDEMNLGKFINTFGNNFISDIFVYMKLDFMATETFCSLSPQMKNFLISGIQEKIIEKNILYYSRGRDHTIHFIEQVPSYKKNLKLFIDKTTMDFDIARLNSKIILRR